MVQVDPTIKLGKPVDIREEEGNYTPVSSAFTETEETDSNTSLVHAIIGYTFSFISGITLTLELLIIKRNPFLGDRHLFWAFLTNTLLSAALMLALENQCCLATGLMLPWLPFIQSSVLYFGVCTFTHQSTFLVTH